MSCGRSVATSGFCGFEMMAALNIEDQCNR
jgi:hypothetical protein